VATEHGEEEAIMKVRGYAALGPGNALEPFEYDVGLLGANAVEIQIEHCGMCHTDLHLVNNDFGFSQYPLVPGHEIIGTVSQVGSAVKSFKEGQRVGVGWNSGCCGECEYCAQGEENLCLKWEGTCTHGFGGYASVIRVNSRFVFAIPDGMDSAKTAPLLCGGITVYGAFHAYGVTHATHVGVVGVGGLGHLALQYARAFGCEVTAFSSSPDKEAEARRFGAHHFVNSQDPSAMGRLNNSLDFILSTACADLNWAAYMGVLKPKGRLCFVGVPPSDIRVPAAPLILGQKSVCGNPVGSPSLIREMLEFSARNRVEAQVERMPMDRVNEALDRLRANKARYRIVLEN
jgi:uncharacterized zinc-type alcohol dehydrogenase-like protein